MDILSSINEYLSNQSKTQLNKAERIINAAARPLKVKIAKDGIYVVRVPSESTTQIFKVEIEYDESDEELFIECQCQAYWDHDDCKHCVAAAITVQNSLDERVPAHVLALPEPKPKEPGETHVYHFTMDRIDSYRVMELAGHPSRSLIYTVANKLRPGPTVSPHQYFGYYDKSKKLCDIDILFDGGDGFETRCNCGDTRHPLCNHVAAGFLFLESRYGMYYFNKFKHFTEEKNKILAEYGLTVNDPEAKDFEWSVSHWGQLSLKSKPDYLISAGNKAFFNEIKKSILGDAGVTFSMLRPRLGDNIIVDYEVGFLFNFVSTKHIKFELEPVFVREKKGRTDVKKLVINNQSNHAYLQSLNDDLFYRLMELSDQKLVDSMAKTGSNYLTLYANPWQMMNDKDGQKLRKHYFEHLQGLWPMLCQEPFIFQLTEGHFSNANVRPAKLSDRPFKLVFEVNSEERFIVITMNFKTSDAEAQQGGHGIIRGKLLLDVDGVFFLPENAECVQLVEMFENKLLKFPVIDRLDVLRNVVLPLQAKYEVNVSDNLQFDTSSPEPQPHLLLKEFDEKFLMLKPRIQYGDVLVDYDEGLEHFEESDGKLTIIKRDKPAEKRLYEYLRTLHPKFSSQRNKLYYFLPFGEVMTGGWFLSMIKQVQEAGYPVFGLQDLKNFRYNTNTPVFNIEAGSGIDWFDLKIEISWGDQQVSLKDIRKALLNKQQAILLDDGTLGMIPAEWLEQYGMLLKIGSERGDKLQVSKLHYSLLDDLGTRLNNAEVEREIAEKKSKLQNFTGMQDHLPPSARIIAELRPYQLTGFQWLQTLDDLGWGGCLADDMGLGKTLQAITFLQFLKEKYHTGTHLIICPTSLIFNWENELNKFCPDLKYHIYYGTLRTFDDSHFEQFDIILTSYGVVRIDIEHLTKFNWHYVILDESQAIKNPDAQVTKSVQLLNAKNRLILSGTPVQNNTYDLFAQFNFINPGFLGHREFFKNEFATPIDKYGEKLKSEQLRRMIYPFMLRRTKQQVATDLPDKTEMILWCSMNKAQRSMYDEYKNYYRNMLLKKIDDEGMGRSGIYILEGLLRLRQICDHPSLIKGDTDAPEDSVKTEELMREIQENSGGHKLLVFSQFTEMLSIIRKELDRAGISYCYLDGSTAAKKRKEEVQRFQEDENVKVFLVSLKAGGVGLNLTAADYVYLVDPWWNPAVEQQAIDRTHRIGQVNKIFAYKMICKDTVEEKILQLQQKKKSLADELISEEAGFVKKLTRDDIAFLFS